MTDSLGFASYEVRYSKLASLMLTLIPEILLLMWMKHLSIMIMSDSLGFASYEFRYSKLASFMLILIPEILLLMWMNHLSIMILAWWERSNPSHERDCLTYSMQFMKKMQRRHASKPHYIFLSMIAEAGWFWHFPHKCVYHSIRNCHPLCDQLLFIFIKSLF